MRVRAPAYDQTIVNSRFGGNHIRLTECDRMWLPKLFKDLSPSLQQRWIAVKSIRAEAGIAQRQNLPAGARGRYKNARTFPKVALNQRRK